jgi:molecular chaperone GrpE
MSDHDEESHGAPPPAGDPVGGGARPGGATTGDTAGSFDAPREPPDDDLAGFADPLGDAPLATPPADLAPGPDDDAEPAELAETDPIVALTRERDDYREALIRLQADFENYKKRMIRQQTDHLERAATALVDKLLPVLDTADLALAHGGGEDVKQLTGALTNVLEREGLERIDPDGGPFDPTLHDAVAHEPSDDGYQEVVEVMRAGYRWKGRVLRPAMVKVRG